MSAGIYEIRNQVNSKRYIGSAVNLRKRRSRHLSALRRGQHTNRHLQAAFDKYGEPRFAFSLLEHVENAEGLIEREQHYLDRLKPEYNIAPTAGSSLGVQRTEETRRKMSEAKSGDRNPNYGKPLSEEHRKKLSEALTGRRLSSEHCRNLSEAHKGKHLSAETRAKISAARKGQRPPMYGKHHSGATRQKLSEAQKGKHHSAETRAKISEAWTPRRRKAQADKMRGNDLAQKMTRPKQRGASSVRAIENH